MTGRRRALAGALVLYVAGAIALAHVLAPPAPQPVRPLEVGTTTTGTTVGARLARPPAP